MRRIAALLTLLAACGCFAILGSGAGESDPGNEYFVELDNAFGLIEGGDLKIAGVRAGTITRLKLDRRTKRAIVGFRVTRDGFGSLRTDATCATRPQSLIGEYFVDCQPGRAAEKLPADGRIPVSQTTTTVGPDLVNTVLRRPYRERLSIIINELGAAVAGNEENLNDAVRRAAPALRETDAVLAKLADQSQTLAELTTNADTVIGDLNANREDVGRWVVEAGRTAKVSATRKAQIAEGFRRLPAFLDELGPTMESLGGTVDAQTPALRDLRASADRLEELFDRLGPFADASEPAVDALGEASVTGDGAVKVAQPVVSQLRSTAAGAPELAKNLAIVLEHLDDPKNALEEDPRAAKATGRPAPTGYTGLEAFLTYAYDQTLSTNIFDQNNHLLKIGAIGGGNCADYADVPRAKEVGQECAAALGPNGPGVTSEDTTDPRSPAAVRRASLRRVVDPENGGPGLPSTSPGRRDARGADGGSSPGGTSAGRAPLRVGPIEIPQGPGASAQDSLLDYLLGT